MRILLIAALIILLNGTVSWVMNLPQDAGLDVPDGKLNSLSFAPFREGQNPLLLQFPTPDQIEEDLKLLSDKTHTIRTYSSTEGMRPIPALAQKYGLKMIQGAWIGYLKADSQAEIDALVESANRYPDVVKRVIVGNEVLLRGERKPEELVEYIRQVKKRVTQPVSYADVWSMYMKYPELIKEVDFITIHILPYWEDKPIPVDKAPEHIERIYKQVQKEAETISPGKPILIGESGWPSEGRQRGWAVPSVVNEAAFIRGLLEVAAVNRFDVNIVEAFNQSWKSELEGVVGANWGLFSVERKEVFPLTGKVYENSEWLDQFTMASLLLILCIVCFANNLKACSSLKIFVFLAFLQLLCAVLVFQGDKSWYTSYNDWQRFKTILVVLLNGIVAALVSRRAFDLLAGKLTKRGITVALDVVYLIVFALMLYKTYLLAADGRYISFPFEIAAIPVIGLAGLFCIQCLGNPIDLKKFDFNRLTGRSPEINRRNKWLGWLTVFYTAGLVAGETKAFMIGRDFILEFPSIGERLGWALVYTLTNGQLIGWLVCLLVVSWSLLTGKQRLT